MSNHEEGDKCPECDGILGFPKVEGCSCHIAPPCGACTSINLTCPLCGWEQPEPERVIEIGERQFCPGVTERYVKNPRTDLGDGKVLFDYDYNGESGSTMVWVGRYEGPVTAADILKHFGDGTFGHRGPSLCNGRFMFTQITD